MTHLESLMKRKATAEQTLSDVQSELTCSGDKHTVTVGKTHVNVWIQNNGAVEIPLPLFRQIVRWFAALERKEASK